MFGWHTPVVIIWAQSRQICTHEDSIFSPKLLQSLPSDNIEALAALCAEFERFDGHARQLPDHHGDYVEALSILRGFAIA